MRRCVIGQSGGPTTMINATLAGLIKAAFQERYDRVYGMVHGLVRLLDEHLIDLKEFQDVSKQWYLAHTPAMYLGSCRFKISPQDIALQQRILDILDQYGITDFFYIGGNDSMDTIKILSDYARKVHSKIHFIGVPKTIDNDLLHTYYTPGYPSACHYVATTLLEIAFDSVVYPNRAVTIVEIMGRDAGWLTASAQLVNEMYPDTIDLIYLPEDSFDREDFLHRVTQILNHKAHCMIAVSEGVHLGQDGVNKDDGIQQDAFGHHSPHGCSNDLKKWIMDTIGCKVRAIQLSTLQRCASHLISSVDLKRSLQIGIYAIECALHNKTGIMVSFKEDGTCDDVSIQDVANYVKSFPISWIDVDQKRIKKEYIDYVVPLIYESGQIELPHYLKRS